MYYVVHFISIFLVKGNISITLTILLLLDLNIPLYLYNIYNSVKMAHNNVSLNFTACCHGNIFKV